MGTDAPAFETEGQLLARMGTDALKWAEEWTRVAKRLYENDGITALIGTVDSPPDLGWMICWFANAIGAGDLEARIALRDDLEAARAEIDRLTGQDEERRALDTHRRSVIEALRDDAAAHAGSDASAWVGHGLLETTLAILNADDATCDRFVRAIGEAS